MTLVDVSLTSGWRLIVADVGGGEYQVAVTSPNDEVKWSVRRSTPDDAIVAAEEWLIDIGKPLVSSILGTNARAELHR